MPFETLKLAYAFFWQVASRSSCSRPGPRAGHGTSSAGPGAGATRCSSSATPRASRSSARPAGWAGLIRASPRLSPVHSATTHHSFRSARSRLYRNEILHPNTHFAAFFKIYKTIYLIFQKKFRLCKISPKNAKNRRSLIFELTYRSAFSCESYCLYIGATSATGLRTGGANEEGCGYT